MGLQVAPGSVPQREAAALTMQLQQLAPVVPSPAQRHTSKYFPSAAVALSAPLEAVVAELYAHAQVQEPPAVRGEPSSYW